jgi:hypothetical protein
MNEAISNKVNKKMGLKKVEADLMEVEEEPQEEKKGFLATLFGSSKPKSSTLQSGSKDNKEKREMKAEKCAAEDSDEDEMEIKGYMMEKNEDFD